MNTPAPPDRIRIHCPGCDKRLRIRAECIGLRVACKECEHSFEVPRHVTVRCPHCAREGRVGTKNLGRNLACKACGKTFLGESKPARPPEQAGEDPRPVERLRETERELAAVRDASSRLEQALAESRAECGRYAEALREAVTRVERAESNAPAQARAADAARSEAANVRAELETLRRECLSLRSELDASLAASREGQVALERGHEALNEAVTRANHAEERSGVMGGAAEAAGLRFDQFRAAVAAVVAPGPFAPGGASVEDPLIGQLLELRQRNDRLAGQLDDARGSLAAYEGASSEADRLREELAALEKQRVEERDAHRRESEALAREADEERRARLAESERAKHAAAELATLGQSSLRAENESRENTQRLTRELEAERRRVQELASQVEQLSARLNSAQAEVARLLKENAAASLQHQNARPETRQVRPEEHYRDLALGEWD